MLRGDVTRLFRSPPRRYKIIIITITRGISIIHLVGIVKLWADGDRQDRGDSDRGRQRGAQESPSHPPSAQERRSKYFR